MPKQHTESELARLLCAWQPWAELLVEHKLEPPPPPLLEERLYRRDALMLFCVVARLHEARKTRIGDLPHTVAIYRQKKWLDEHPLKHQEYLLRAEELTRRLGIFVQDEPGPSDQADADGGAEQETQ